MVAAFADLAANADGSAISLSFTFNLTCRLPSPPPTRSHSGFLSRMLRLWFWQTWRQAGEASPGEWWLGLHSADSDPSPRQATRGSSDDASDLSGQAGLCLPGWSLAGHH